MRPLDVALELAVALTKIFVFGCGCGVGYGLFSWWKGSKNGNNHRS